MAFTAEITFTGICGIVPRQDPPTDPEAFCFVLPNAYKTSPNPGDRKTSTVDGLSRLRRHVAFVHFSTRQFDSTNKRRDLDGLWFLQGNALEFNPRFAGSPPPAAWGDINGLAGFEDVVADPVLVSVANVVNTPTATKLAARVVLRNGMLTSPLGSPNYVFDNYLRTVPEPASRRLNHRAIVTLPDLDSLEIARTDFQGGSTGRTITFTQGPIFITVANLCDENPLQWGDKPAPAEIPDDDDFRWHYEIVDDPVALGDALDNVGSPRCPIPRLSTDLAGGNGLNCDPIRFPRVGFSI